jgi:hypothetical protein
MPAINAREIQHDNISIGMNNSCSDLKEVFNLVHIVYKGGLTQFPMRTPKIKPPRAGKVL